MQIPVKRPRSTLTQWVADYSADSRQANLVHHEITLLVELGAVISLIEDLAWKSTWSTSMGADSELARLRLVYQFRLGHPYPYHRIRQFYMVLSIRNEGMLCCICVSQTIPFGPSLT